MAADDQVVVMVGEELPETVGTMDAAAWGLQPALHAVKVDPQAANLSRPHFRPDPAQDWSMEARVSAALILRHEVVCAEQQ